MKRKRSDEILRLENMWVDKAGDSCDGYTIVKDLGRGGNSVVKLVEKNN